MLYEDYVDLWSLAVIDHRNWEHAAADETI